MKNLLVEYRGSLKNTMRMIDDCKDESELKILNSIKNELEFIIDWIVHGKNPMNYTEIASSATYLVDPDVIEAMVSTSMYDVEKDVKEEPDFDEVIKDDKKPFRKILSKLTARELEAYILHECEGYSQAKTSELMGVKKGSSQCFIERARLKIQKELLIIELQKTVQQIKFDLSQFQAILKLAKYDKRKNAITFDYLEGTGVECVLNIMSLLSNKAMKYYCLIECLNYTIEDVMNECGVSQLSVNTNYKKAVKTINQYLY